MIFEAQLANPTPEREQQVIRDCVEQAVLAEAIRRLKSSGAVLVWANARDSALPFYEKVGFRIAPDSEFVPPQTGHPHHLIELNLRP